MFQITSDYQSEIISDWCIFRIGFKLISDWFQIVMNNLKLRLQISDCSILLQIHFKLAVLKKTFQTGSLKKNISD